MKSSFEQRLANERVDAVERRWRQEDEAIRRVERAAALKRHTAYAFLVALLLALGVGTWIYFDHEMPVNVSVGEVKNYLQGGKSLSSTERTSVDDFTEALGQFDAPELRLWKDVPQKLRPRNAVRGLVYRMLIEKAGGVCGVYEMVADGKGGLEVSELVPTGKPVKTTLDDFNRAKASKVYLIRCQGAVYVGGTEDPAAGLKFLRGFLKK